MFYKKKNLKSRELFSSFTWLSVLPISSVSFTKMKLPWVFPSYLAQSNGFQYRFLSAVTWSAFTLSVYVRLLTDVQFWNMFLKTLMLGLGGLFVIQHLKVLVFPSSFKKAITAVYYLARCSCWADTEMCLPWVASAQLCFWHDGTWTAAVFSNHSRLEKITFVSSFLALYYPFIFQ